MILGGFSDSSEIVLESKENLDISTYDPDKRIEVSDAGDMDGIKGNIDTSQDLYNPDKRIDINNDGKPDSIQDAVYNPDKRIEYNNIIMESKPLSAEIKQQLFERGMSVSNIEKCVINPNGVIRLKTMNETLSGKEHLETHVKYEQKIIDINGTKVEGVFPKFKSEFETLLPNELNKSTDKEQFCYCNKQLYDAINNDPKLKGKFSSDQIEQIKDGIKDGTAPDGYVWNHNETLGRMELVDFETHNKSAHTGGKSIWGGGNR